MSTQNTTEVLIQKYKELPQDLQDSIFSEKTSDSIRSISTNYKLEIKKMGILADEIGLVLLGVLHPKDFITSLSEKLEIDRETAKQIASDVNQQIFQKVRVSLRKIHNITDTEAPPSPKATEGTAKVSKEEMDAAERAVETEREEKMKPLPTPIFKSPMKPLPSTPPTPSKAPPPVLRVLPPRETPKQEPRPLEIKPIKIQAGTPQPPKTSPVVPETKQEIKKEVTEVMEPTATIPPQEEIKKEIPVQAPENVSSSIKRDRGLRVMPGSPEEIKKPAPAENKKTIKTDKPYPKPPTPPPELPILDKKEEKKLDPYREQI